MKILILGGSKSGKSDFAQEVALKLAEGGVHYYVATLQNTGTEADKATVASHLQRREGMDFVTVEQGRNILGCLEKTDPSGTFLLDSVTTLLTNEIFPPEKNYATDEEAARRCCGDLAAFADKVKHIVIVSDDLSRDAMHYDDATEAFRRHLGAIHCRLAKECDVVMEMAFGNLTIHKGEWE